jgi:hypothetical protein
MRARDLLDDSEFTPRRDVLRIEMKQLEDSLVYPGASQEIERALVERAFDFALDATNVLRTGSLAARRTVVASMGTDLMLRDGNFDFVPAIWLAPLLGAAVPPSRRPRPTRPSVGFSAQSLPERRRKNTPVQTLTCGLRKAKTAAFATVHAHWCSIVNKVQTAIRSAPTDINIPDLKTADSLLTHPGGRKSDE